MDANKKSCELTEYALKLVHLKARHLVGTAGFTRDDVEDIEQELVLDLLARLPQFDPAKASYNTFVARLVDRKISKLVRDRQRERRDPDREDCSLSSLVNEEDGVKAELGDSITQDEHDLRTGKHHRPASERLDMELDVKETLSTLPEELRRVAEVLTAMPVAEAIQALRIPRWKLYEVYLPQLREVFEARGLSGNF
jgi:RNA polymerase sigma-70 factor, ECF subfamily